MTLNADLLVRDTNGNTLAKVELPGLPYEEFSLVESHVSSSGTIILTVALEQVSEDA